MEVGPGRETVLQGWAEVSLLLVLLPMVTLAPYWGIDEVGIFVLPAVLTIVFLRWAERKARKRVESESGDPESTDSNSNASPPLLSGEALVEVRPKAKTRRT